MTTPHQKRIKAALLVYESRRAKLHYYCDTCNKRSAIIPAGPSAAQSIKCERCRGVAWMRGNEK